MIREQEIIKQMLKLAEEFNRLPCDKDCTKNDCWAGERLCSKILGFIQCAKDQLTS